VFVSELKIKLFIRPFDGVTLALNPKTFGKTISIKSDAGIESLVTRLILSLISKYRDRSLKEFFA
jgi:hypothetical protein